MLNNTPIIVVKMILIEEQNIGGWPNSGLIK